VVLRLRLGPVVGHTDDTSARVWIQARDHPGEYKLRVQGAGRFDFVSTEAQPQPEFGTGLAIADGLRPDHVYGYSVLRKGRLVPGARGTFRTMPSPGSPAPLLFCVVSCNQTRHDGVWNLFAAFVEKAKPHFVLMMGDQVYMDEDEPDVFKEHLDSRPSVRRRAMAETYGRNWSRSPVRRVMASVPTYMMWDDHDIRDGWASVAMDSPTLAARYPRGRELFRKNNAYFEDARDVYWHFQGCHNPTPTGDPSLPNYIDGPPSPGQRRAMPFVFRCGRLVVLVLDARGDRDVFRKDFPILGTEQWGFIDTVFANLPADVEALAVMTPTPVASMDPNGQVQNLLGDRTDDVVAFSRGRLQPRSSAGFGETPVAVANVHFSRLLGRQLNLGQFMISKIDEARDQWSHKFARPEQADLLRKAGTARLANVIPGTARGLIFLSGDIHVGCIFDISCSKPEFEAASLTASGISAKEDQAVIVGTFLDEDFTVAPGIRSTLREVTRDFNFGVVQVVPTGTGAEIVPTLAHEGTALVAGLDFAALVR
jgi:PhoD-like phosphatase